MWGGESLFGLLYTVGLQQQYKEAGKALIYFILLSWMGVIPLPPQWIGIHIILGLLIMIKVFYLPFLAAKLLIRTTDVGSLLHALDQIHFPKQVSIPLAMMFRFFPAFRQEHRHIRRAMRVKGITLCQPIQYLKDVTLPLLILSSNIADDIAKAAETKAIANPIHKTHYFPVTLSRWDGLYWIGIFVILWGGQLCSV